RNGTRNKFLEWNTGMNVHPGGTWHTSAVHGAWFRVPLARVPAPGTWHMAAPPSRVPLAHGATWYVVHALAHGCSGVYQRSVYRPRVPPHWHTTTPPSGGTRDSWPPAARSLRVSGAPIGAPYGAPGTRTWTPATTMHTRRPRTNAHAERRHVTSRERLACMRVRARPRARMRPSDIGRARALQRGRTREKRAIRHGCLTGCV